MFLSVFGSLAELVTLTATPQSMTNSLILGAGDGAQLVYSGLVTTGTRVIVQTTNLTTSFDYAHISSALAIGGPATITLSDNVGNSMFTFNVTHSSNPNTLNVIPQGRGAVIQLSTTFDLSSGQWTPLYSQAFTNSTPTNQFFKFVMSPQ